MTVVAISCDQSLNKEASPMPRTVRLSQRAETGLLPEAFISLQSKAAEAQEALTHQRGSTQPVAGRGSRSPSLFPWLTNRLASSGRAQAGIAEFFLRCPRFQSPVADPWRDAESSQCAGGWICRSPSARAAPLRRRGAFRALSARWLHRAGW